MSPKQGQLVLKDKQERVDNPKVRQQIVAALETMEKNNEGRKLYNTAKREFDEAIGTTAQGLEPGESVDVILGKEWFVRLTAIKREPRKATKPGTTVKKAPHRMSELAE